MSVFKKLDTWLVKKLWHKSDIPETLEQKVYLVRNGIIASIFITLFAFGPAIIFRKFQLLLLISPMVGFIVFTDGLLMIIKRGIKWFFYFYYGGYIILCSLLIMAFGGFPTSFGIWIGSFIVFMHTLAVKDRRILFVNAFIYIAGLIAITLSFPYLSLPAEWTPGFNNLEFTINEVWMCLFLVKSFYDSIVLRTNEAKRRAVHLQELDSLKSKLYANITHEFRTPLTLIRGNAEEIREYQSGEIAEKANGIVHHSDKILFLVNQMLNLSKIEEGTVPMHYTQCDLVAFVRFIVGSFQGLADLQKVSLHFEPQSPQLIMDIDAEKLEESLSNLLSNAIKYTPEGGDVFVSVRKLQLAKALEQQVEVNVRDTGIGISEDNLDKIFIRFYRVEDRRFPYKEGTGIGLTLVNEYIRLMKGSIKVKSSPGKGSEFKVTLPVTNKASIGEYALKGVCENMEEITYSEPVSVSFGSVNPRLLIIDDNRELREYLTRLLENKYQIYSAENGIQGVEQAIEYIPDIIMSDVMMPGKDGYEVCKELKSNFRTNHIPIVLLTARADTDSRITGLDQGADAYLTKPFNKKELMICLHQLLVQRESLRFKFTSSLFNKKVDGESAGLNEKFLNSVNNNLEKNYKNDRYGIHQLCSDLEISRVQLHRKLTALTGQSASNFIRNFRLQKARILLLETNKKVSEIAFEVGISDEKYFSKSFINEYGMPATEMRKSFLTLLKQ